MLVHAASGTIESDVVVSRSLPEMLIVMSSPRAARICSRQQLVARVGAEGGDVHVPLGQRREDPDHDLVGADLGALLLGVVERAAQAVLELREAPLAQLGRRHVDLDVELAELGLEVRVGDGLEDLGVLQGRVARARR